MTDVLRFNFRRWLQIDRLTLPFLFLAISCLWPPAAAHADVAGRDASQHFSVGREAFDRGDYQRALIAFLKARSLGMDKPALYYNLGACYYHLEQYRKSRNAFLRVAATPNMADLGHYNLALVAIKTDDREEAVARLQKTLQTTRNDRLYLMARKLLRELGEEPESGSEQRLEALFIANAGYDDNVALAAADQLLGSSQKSDSYLDLFLHGNLTVLGSRYKGLDLQGSGYLLRHTRQNTYDFNYFRVGAVNNFTPSKGRIHYAWGAFVSDSYLNNQPFTRTATLELDSRTVLKGLPVGLKYEFSHIDDLDIGYSYLAGNQHRLRLKTAWQKATRSVKLEYRYEYNDLADLYTATTFSSYSPIRHGLRLYYKQPVARDYHVTLSASWRNSRYTQPHLFADNSTRRREEQRTVLGVSLSRLISQRTEMTLEYRFTDNNSTLNSYTYQRQQLSAGLIIPFP